jgi:hypothetical protein
MFLQVLRIQRPIIIPEVQNSEEDSLIKKEKWKESYYNIFEGTVSSSYSNLYQPNLLLLEHKRREFLLHISRYTLIFQVFFYSISCVLTGVFRN